MNFFSSLSDAKWSFDRLQTDFSPPLGHMHELASLQKNKKEEEEQEENKNKNKKKKERKKEKKRIHTQKKTTNKKSILNDMFLLF